MPRVSTSVLFINLAFIVLLLLNNMLVFFLKFFFVCVCVCVCVCVTAELVVHGERLNRHAEAIAEALSDLTEAPAVISAKLEEKVLMIYKILLITVAIVYS